MNISIDRLRYFIAAAKTEHIGKAAKMLHVSPSVISDGIKQIEIELNKKLFDRVSKKIILNNQGHSLLIKAEAIIDRIELLYEDSNDSIAGEFKLGISLSLYRYSLFDISKIISITKNNPKLNFSFNTSDTGRLVDLVINGLLDAAIVYSPIKHENLIENIIEETSFHIALKKGHPIFKLKTKKQKVDFLNKLPAIGFSASVGDNMCQQHPIFDKFGIYPSYRYFYDIDEVAVSLVNKTDGWIFTSKNIIENNKNLCCLDLGKDWQVPMTISLIANRSKRKLRFIHEIFFS